MRSPERWLLLLLAVHAGSALAHNRSVSYSDWRIDGQTLQAELRLPLAELNPLGLDPRDPQTPARIAQRVQTEFQPSAAGQPCTAISASGRIGGEDLRVSAQWRCAAAAERLRNGFLLDRIPGHLHLLRLQQGQDIRGPWALSAAQPEADWTAPAAATPPQTVAQYWLLGTEHILLGWDHLAYLLVVLLGAGTLGQLAWRISGFTLGHSLTLTLATLGLVRPQPAMVEAFIALTIACTAAERVLAGHPRAGMQAGAIAAVLGLAGWLSGTLPLALGLAAVLLTASAAATPDTRIDSLRTALFGLFHGFGFAGVLATLTQGASIPPLPLLGFNLGVEFGQLLFVLPLWWLLARFPSLRHPLLPAALLATGTLLFLLRL
jgi:hypothetical protein